MCLSSRVGSEATPHKRSDGVCKSTLSENRTSTGRIHLVMLLMFPGQRNLAQKQKHSQMLSHHMTALADSSLEKRAFAASGHVVLASRQFGSKLHKAFSGFWILAGQIPLSFRQEKPHKLLTHQLLKRWLTPGQPAG